jgi:hypothetical protein
MTSSEFFDSKDFNNTFDFVDEWAKLKCIEFGVWLSINCVISNSHDGWVIYEKEHKTIDEVYEIYFKILKS